MKQGRRVLALILSFCMILGLCACGKKKDEGSNGLVEDTSNYTFVETNFDLTGYKGEVSNLVVKGDSIYFRTVEYTEDEEAAAANPDYDGTPMKVTSRLYKASLEGGTAEEIGMPSNENDDYLYYFLLSDDLTFYLIYSVDSGNGEETYRAVKFKEGETEENFDVDFIRANMGDDWINSVELGPDNTIIVSYGEKIITFDMSGKVISTAKVDSAVSYLTGLTVAADGTVYTTVMGEEGTSVKVLDVKTGEFTDEYKLENANDYSGGSVIAGSDGYDFYYQTSSGVFGYKVADKSAEKILDNNASMIDTFSMINQVMVNKDTMLAIVSDDFDAEGKFVKYVKADPESVANKTVLTCMTLYGNYELKQQIIKYNKASDKYRIDLIDYSEKDDPMAAMSADIAAGKIPDIYDVSYGIGNLSVKQCIGKGMFEDLTSYYDNDPDVNRDMILPGVYEALQMDGKIYFTAPAAEIITLIAKTSEIGDLEGWTFTEMKEFVESKPDDARIFYSTSKEDNLREFLYLNVDDFVNWSTGECQFDTQGFKDILAMCNRASDEEMNYDDYDEKEYIEMLKSGKILFLEGYMTPDQFAIYENLFGGDISFVGYPSPDRSGNYFSFNGCLAISAQSKYKDIAWDFIKIFMTKEYQSSNYIDTYGLPTRTDIFDAYLKKYTTTKKYTDEWGNEIEPISGSMGVGGLEVENKPLTADQEKAYRDLVDNTKKGLWYDSSLQDIIIEEAKTYFSGEKSLDEVCSVIQNRVTTYVNENK